VLNTLGFRIKGQPTPIDGVNLLPLIEGKTDVRPQPIGFQSSGQSALIDNRYKLIKGGKDRKKGAPATAKGSRPDGYMLFDIVKDPGETADLAAEKLGIVEAMKEALE